MEGVENCMSEIPNDLISNMKIEESTVETLKSKIKYLEKQIRILKLENENLRRKLNVKRNSKNDGW